MRLIRSILLAVLLVSLATSVNSIECLSSTFENKYALMNDTLAIDLSAGTSGNKIQFTITTDPEFMENPFLQEYTFSAEFTDTDLQGTGITNCSAQTGGINENDYVFLCNKNRIGFVTYEKTNGAVTSKKGISLGADYECQALSSSPAKGRGYVACLKTGTTTLALIKLDLELKEVSGTPFEIEQTNVDHVIKNNLKVLVDDYTYSDIPDTLIYIYEDATGSNTVRFRLVKDKDVLINGGFYSKESGTTTNLVDGNLVGFYYDGQSVLIATRDASNNNKLQRCYRSPVMNKYNCNPNAINLEQGVGMIRMNFVDPTLRTSRMMNVYMASLTSVAIGTFDPVENTYNTVLTQDISGNMLTKITEMYPVGTNYLYLVGPRNADRPGNIDGVVQFSISASGYQQNDYDYAATLAFVRRDYFNPDFANFIQVADEVTFFYIFKKDAILINTRSFDTDDKEKDYSNIQYTIKCTAEGAEPTSVSFNLYTMLNVNDNITFSVPDAIAYYGSAKVPIPSDDELISGNAPVLTLKTTNGTDAGIKLNVDMVKRWPLNMNATADMDVKHVRFIGDSSFVIYSDLLARFYWTSMKSDNTVGFYQSSHQIDLTNYRFLSAMAENNAMISLYSTSLNKSNDVNQQAYTTVIERVDFTTSDIKKIVVNFYAQIGTVKFEGSTVWVYVIGSHLPNQPKGLYYMRFDIRNAEPPQEFTFIQYLEEHVCPQELSWTPKDGIHLYIASTCNDVATDSHVYQFEINFDDPYLSKISNTYQITGSVSFRMCAQNRLINIIDYQQSVVYSIDTKDRSTTYDKYELPLEPYGIKQIIGHSCNQDDNMLQIIGNTESKKTFMIAFRADDIRYPEQRVHSVTPIDSKYVKIAASYSNNSDNIVVMLFGSKTSVIDDLVLSVEGPHIDLDITSVKTAETYALNYQLTLIGDPQRQIVGETTLKLINQPVNTAAVLADPSKKLNADGSLINLDNYIIVDAPYHTFNKSIVAPGIVMSDRLTPSNQFAAVTDLFDDATFYQDYIFGYKSDEAGTVVLELNQNTNNLLKLELPANSSVKKVDYAVSDNNVFFFAHVGTRLENDKIYTLYYKAEEKTWMNEDFELSDQSFQDAFFIATSNANKFVFAAYNNDIRNEIFLLAFELIADHIEPGVSFTKSFENNISDFDFISVQNGGFILLVGQEYIRKADFFWLYLNENNDFSEMGTQQYSLVPNAIESHQGIAFACQYTLEGSDNFLTCVHSGKNAYSYHVRYTVVLDDMEVNNFIRKSQVASLLANIVNLTPVKVDFLNNYVAFLVKNEAQAKAPGIVSYFSSAYVLLVYNTQSLTPAPANVWDAPVRHAYKVLVPGDFGVPSSTNLANMVPKFFLNSQGQVKLGVNIDNVYSGKVTSVRVFNLDSLTISLKADQLNGDALLPISSIDDTTYSTPLSSIFNQIPPAPKPDDKDKTKSKNTKWILIAIGIIILVTLIVGAVLIKMNRDKAQAEDAAIADVEHTMKPADGSSVSGNYSKI